MLARIIFDSFANSTRILLQRKNFLLISIKKLILFCGRRCKALYINYIYFLTFRILPHRDIFLSIYGFTSADDGESIYHREPRIYKVYSNPMGHASLRISQAHRCALFKVETFTVLWGNYRAILLSLHIQLSSAHPSIR